MNVLYVITFCCLVGSFTCEETTKRTNRRLQRRDGGITAAIIGGAIASGASLTGTTVSALRDNSYRVSVTGTIENYSRWTLALQTCEIDAGHMNQPMRSIHSGFKEGFATHKTSNTATGSFVRCTFKAAGYYIHIMYSAPYSFDLHSNWLGVAICPVSSNECRKLDADAMYDEDSDYVKLKEYDTSVGPLTQCYGVFCFSGEMGTSHKTTVHMKIYPKKYDDLSETVQTQSAKKKFSNVDYKQFLNTL